jgi:hypothetical protein
MTKLFYDNNDIAKDILPGDLVKGFHFSKFFIGLLWQQFLRE